MPTGWKRWPPKRPTAAPACGKCFEVCPTAREIGLDAGEAQARVGELSALTQNGGPPPTA